MYPSSTHPSSRPFKLLLLCLVLALSACSSSGGDDEVAAPSSTPATTTSTTEPVAETTTPVLTVPPLSPPGSLTAQEAVETCPSVDSLSSATELSFTGVEATVSEVDLLASDPDSEITLCVYQSDGSTVLLVGLHSSPINKALFVETPLPNATVDELSTGAIQIQFDGRVGCEIYDDRVSLVLTSEADFADSCATVMAAREAVQ